MRVSFLWIDQNEKLIPVIALDEIAKVPELFGPDGSTAFLIFDATWKRAAHMHRCSFGNSRNGENSGYSMSRDAEGHLEIAASNGGANGDPSYSYVYIWNGAGLIIDPKRNAIEYHW